METTSTKFNPEAAPFTVWEPTGGWNPSFNQKDKDTCAQLYNSYIEAGYPKKKAEEAAIKYVYKLHYPELEW